ncbi:MAG: response regulator, partial [Herminiimonas sp.]|nr:response regulator [Herminiimonas sp.]
IEGLLKIYGVHADYVENGQQAVAAITGGMVTDMVLMDCQMPVMDGFEATRQIRRWEEAHGRPRLPIVAVTAHTMDSEFQHCLSAGMDALVCKPIEPALLRGALARWMAPRQALAATAVLPQPIAAEYAALSSVLGSMNIAAALERLEGDNNLYQEILDDCDSEFRCFSKNLRLALDEKDFDTAEMRAHTLKGLAATIGAREISDIAAILEKSFKSRSLEDVGDRLEDIELHLMQVCDAISWTLLTATSLLPNH